MQQKPIIEFLKAHQLGNGSFLSYSLAAEGPSIPHPRSTTFFSSLILAAIADLPECKEVAERTATFLHDQASPDWSFGYWIRTTQDSHVQPYPDDLDDTFWAATALARYHHGQLPPAALARLTYLLTQQEVREGGPYRTWIVPDEAPEEWQQADLAVNSAIAMFLQTLDIELLSITDMAEEAIATGSYRSAFYPNPYLMWYTLSTWYRGPFQQTVCQHILDRRSNGIWNNPLHTALAYSALRNLGCRHPLSDTVSYLKEQRSFHHDALCLDPAKNGVRQVASSPAATAAWVLHALSKAASSPEPATFRPIVPSGTAAFCDYAERQAWRMVAEYEEPLHSRLAEALTRILRTDKAHSIVALPYRAYHAIPSPEPVAEETLVSLSLSGICGWMAYTLYDDLLDGDAETSVLPAANICLRRMVTLFERNLADRPEFLTFLHHLIDTMEQANAVETTDYRFDPNVLPLEIPSIPPSLSLADRSIGHAIPTLAAIAIAEQDDSTKTIRLFLTFYRHYLAARQLQDDMHDIHSDLHHGHLTLPILLTLPHVTGTGLASLESSFWQYALDQCAGYVNHHLQEAASILTDLSGLSDTEYLYELLVPLQQATAQALSERTWHQEFIEAYEDL